MRPTKLQFRNNQLSVFSNDQKGHPQILFLHGNSGSSKIWKKQFESKLDDEFHLVAFDFLGIGDSDHSENTTDDYSITGLTDSVVRVVEEYGLQNFFIVGHSLGGHVAVQTLNRLPGCKGLMSIAAPPISIPPAIEKIYLPTAPVGVMFQKDYSDEDLIMVCNNFFCTAETEPDFFKDDFRNTDAFTRAAIGGILGSDQFQDEVIVLGNSNVAKAFVCGELEKSVNTEYYLSLDFPNTWEKKVHVVPGAGHVPQWENAEFVNDLIRRFVSGNA